ncbi:hypothetical protein DB30_07381 [Enhygromyxa salina]|uniref:Uncharacterized protein n=2 Tax=Enhygromyxa salina TaxID=215803 RepID=A0A0C2CWG9_9BACT|nr:hypothetical protein DB30_07381 [Enhygromyxa salina]
MFRSGDPEQMDDASLQFWLQIPPEDRLAVVWELSVEVFGLGCDEPVERRPPRSSFRVVRR